MMGAVDTDTRRGDKLREARRSAQFTQDQLAAALGVSGRSVRGWETHGNVPRAQRANLAKHLKVDIFSDDTHLEPDSDGAIDPEHETLSVYLKRRKMELGLNSDRALGRRVGVAHETLRSLINEERRATDATLKKISAALGGDITSLRKAAGLPTGELGPWTPPAAADQMSAHDRELVSTLINRLVRAERER